MAESIGTVSKMTGVAYARAENGTLRDLRLGDDVYEGEVLVTAGGSVVEVSVPDAPAIVLPGDRELLLSNEVILAGNTAEESMIEEDSLSALIAALESGENDILAKLEATAAGIGAGGGSFIRLGRIGFGLQELQGVNELGGEANNATVLGGEANATVLGVKPMRQKRLLKACLILTCYWLWKLQQALR